jgi:hypothetical protein
MVSFARQSYIGGQMESPKQEPEETMSAKSTKGGGCTSFLVRAGIGLAIIFLVDYLVALIFESAWPHDTVTSALIPFQNHYLATTDAFVTNEGLISEFTNDPGATARFLGLVIIPFVAMLLLSVVLYLIPFTNKLLPYIVPAFFVSLFVLMIYCMFFPPVMTVFDRERKVMIVHRPEWMFFGTKTEIPFEQISGFTYEIETTDGNNHYEDVQYADLFATTTNGKVFIGANQVGAHTSTHDEPQNIPIFKETRQEIERTVEALQLLIGKGGPTP